MICQNATNGSLYHGNHKQSYAHGVFRQFDSKQLKFDKRRSSFRDMARQRLPSKTTPFKTEAEDIPDDDWNYKANKFRCPYRCMSRCV